MSKDYLMNIFQPLPSDAKQKERIDRKWKKRELERGLYWLHDKVEIMLDEVKSESITIREMKELLETATYLMNLSDES